MPKTQNDLENRLANGPRYSNLICYVWYPENPLYIANILHELPSAIRNGITELLELILSPWLTTIVFNNNNEVPTQVLCDSKIVSVIAVNQFKTTCLFKAKVV